MRRRQVSLLLLALALAGCVRGNVHELTAGTCFDDVSALADEGGGEVGQVPVVDCDEPHDNEVFGTFALEAEDYPGLDAVGRQAEAGCRDRFEDYVGAEPDEAGLVVSHLVPTAQSWSAADDRQVVCFLYDLGLGKLEGSVAGTGGA